MRRFLILCIITGLIPIAGCSTTGNNVAYNSPLDNNAVLTEKKETTKVVRKESVKPRKEVVQNIDDEDDIVSLLGEDYNKNFDIPIVFNDAVKYFIQYFTNEKRKVFSNWLKRSRFYIPIIKEILSAEGLPEDLVYLAMIESGFNPKAYSPANASGPWQFIYATGGRYGLRSNYWIDERRDPEKSTVAATKYLRDLFNQFGCWYLAAAGYNAGEGRIEKAIVRHNTNDFWELVKYNTLPKETREYIPKLIAAAIIAKDPEKFGFGSIVYDQPVRFMEMKVPAGFSLYSIAKAASIDINALKSINPEILRGITPPDTHDYMIKLPNSVDKNTFNSNLQLVLNNEKKIKGVSTYKVRKGDTVIKIAKKYRITPDEMLLVNGSGEEMKVKPGIIISIPRFNDQPVKEAGLLKAGKNKTVAKLYTKEVSKRPDVNNTEKKERPIITHHIVKKGETLAAISNKYGMDISSIKSANKLKTDTVYPNMKLRLVNHIQKKEKKGIKYHIVKKGETLATISNKYGTDISSIKSANKLKTNAVYPNMKLRIFSGEV
ncbi:MAG: LysM peptidoglycan-binding domain-containing protein [Proteobacteria bacterium]|nr:LysM peptidoglycan-binding domain-containing protein [Pseudomonadota bacterium]